MESKSNFKFSPGTLVTVPRMRPEEVRIFIVDKSFNAKTKHYDHNLYDLYELIGKKRYPSVHESQVKYHSAGSLSLLTFIKASSPDGT